MAELWVVRPQSSTFEPDAEYENDPYQFTLKIHHGGKFKNGPGGRTYVLGHVDFVDKVHSEYFSVIILKNMLEELGYLVEEVVGYHYRVHGVDLDAGLRPLGSDKDVIEMIEHVQHSKVIEVYVEHFKTHPRKKRNVERPVEDLNADLNADLNVDVDDYQFSSDEGVVERAVERAVERDVERDVYWSDGSEGNDDGSNKSVEGDDESEDSDYIIDEDYLDDVMDVNDKDDFRAAVDFDISDDGEEDNVDLDDALGLIDMEEFDSDSCDDTPLEQALRLSRKKNRGTEDVNNPFYIGQTFDDKDSIKWLVKQHAIDSRRQLHVKFNDNRRYRVICLGVDPTHVRYESKEDGTKVGGGSKAICLASSSGTSKGKSVKSTPKKKDKIATCPWTLHISNVRKGSWTVKTYLKEHTCLHTRDVSLCTINWLAKEIEPTIKSSNSSTRPRELAEDLTKKYQVQITPYQMSRAKTMAERKVLGDFQAQYGYLRDYTEELIRSNPGTTVKLDIEPSFNPEDPTRQFRRIYICFGALKEGFRLGGRDILGLDGCFMKGPFPGQILTAVGIDANNGIYPLAFSLVEAETTDSWTWFLECLGGDLNLVSNSNFTFISDRQKGIIPAIQNVFPSAEHRYCLRHIHENMKSRWRGVRYKNMFQRCAFATTPQEFERRLKQVEGDDKALHAWLKEIPPRHWSRAYFSVRPKCDVLLNNLCEVFNRQLVGARDKPVITCLEYIREYMMKRMVVVHKTIAKCQGPLTPVATIIFDKIKAEANMYTVIWNGSTKYQVTGPTNEKRAVDMEQRTCSCRRWELMGMPCRHAVACIYNMAMNGQGDGIAERWVDEVYWLETWKKVYAKTLEPINSMDLWPISPCPITLTAPKYHKQIGRPKKKRKKSAEEILELSQKLAKGGKLTREGGSVTCDNCKQVGHNKRSCGKRAQGGSVKAAGSGKKAQGGTSKAAGKGKKAQGGTSKVAAGKRKRGAI